MCELLGIEQSVLERAFSYRTVEAKLEKVSTTLNVAQVRVDVELFKCLRPGLHRHAPVPLVTPTVHTHTRADIKITRGPLLLPDWPFWVSILIHLSARTVLYYK